MDDVDKVEFRTADQWCSNMSIRSFKATTETKVDISFVEVF